jgi:hypothetical protein
VGEQQPADAMDADTPAPAVMTKQEQPQHAASTAPGAAGAQHAGQAAAGGAGAAAATASASAAAVQALPGTQQQQTEAASRWVITGACW